MDIVHCPCPRHYLDSRHPLDHYISQCKGQFAVFIFRYLNQKNNGRYGVLSLSGGVSG
jgi:hypothetical protein